MAEKYDTQDIIDRTDLVELVSRYVTLKKEGSEYVGLCVAHADKKPSMFVVPDKKFVHCFACGYHQDAIGFLQAVEGIDFPEACKRLLNGSGTGLPNPQPVAQRERKKPPKRITTPPPDGTPPPDMRIKGIGGAPVAIWTYHTPEGKPWGYVARYQTDEGKTIRCWTWGRRTEDEPEAWACGHFTDPRPLYNLHVLAQYPNRQVLICEGEKSTDAAQQLFPDMVCMTWPGGAQALHNADWSPLSGRRVVLFPDNDPPGIEAMAKLAKMLHKAGASEVKGIRPVSQPDGSDTPPKWDIADAEGWTPESALAWAKPRVFKYGVAEPVLADADLPPISAYSASDVPLSTDEPDAPPATLPAPANEPESASGEVPLPVKWREMGLSLTDKGSPLMNLDNAVRVLENDRNLRGHVWYDEFLDAVITDWNGPQRQWKDADDMLLCLYLQRHIGLTRLSPGQAHDSALIAAFHNVRNEVHEYLNGLEWDGIDRLAYLMSEGFGADHDDYSVAVGRCWMVSMVARAMNPGCKVDTVPVLEGKQGKQKSTALSIIGGKWFVECHENVMSKDFYGVLTGHLLVEISEMHSFTRAEVERIKGIISCQVDRYRKAYGRHTEDHPRHTVLVGTTNRDDYHKDETGGRRFLPILCTQIDLNWLTENRDQLWAEAVSLYSRVPRNAPAQERVKAGAAWWDFPEADQAAAIDSRRDVDAWESAIEEWLNGTARKSVRVEDILNDCLEIKPADQDQMRQKRVGRVLRALGWTVKVRRDPDGRNRKVWMRED